MKAIDALELTERIIDHLELEREWIFEEVIGHFDKEEPSGEDLTKVYKRLEAGDYGTIDAEIVAVNELLRTDGTKGGAIIGEYSTEAGIVVALHFLGTDGGVCIHRSMTEDLFERMEPLFEGKEASTLIQEHLPGRASYLKHLFTLLSHARICQAKQEEREAEAGLRVGLEDLSEEEREHAIGERLAVLEFLGKIGLVGCQIGKVHGWDKAEQFVSLLVLGMPLQRTIRKDGKTHYLFANGVALTLERNRIAAGIAGSPDEVKAVGVPKVATVEKIDLR